MKNQPSPLPHFQHVFRITLIAALLAGFLTAGPRMPDRAVAADMFIGGYTGCVNPTDQEDLPTEECLALVTLYNSTAGAGWTDKTGWLQSNTPCTNWYGVTCNSGHVLFLDLNNNNLIGTIPLQLSNLTNLQSLRMQYNGLTGTIPPQLSRLDFLQDLYLYGNQLTGSIPVELATMPVLIRLYLYGNQLTGSIPPELGSSPILYYLRLNNNNLTGAIPPELGNLSNLKNLHLNNNDLSGTVPSELGNLSNLEQLELHNTLLSGPLPQSLTTITAVNMLNYANSSLCAPGNTDFTTWMGGITTLTTNGDYCDPIFTDGFESGDTSAWSSTVESPIQLGGLFSGQYIPPGLGLIVHPKAAYVGSYGLGAIVEDNHPMFVQDDTPTAETQYRARFNLLVKSLTADPNKGMGILFGGGTGKSFQVFAGWVGGQHVITARVGEDDGSWTWTGFFTVAANDWALVEVDWAAATGDGNNDGYFSLYLDGVLQETVPTLDNDTVTVDTVRLGPFYVSPSATGIIGFDAFSSETVFPEP